MLRIGEILSRCYLNDVESTTYVWFENGKWVHKRGIKGKLNSQVKDLKHVKKD